MVTTESNNLELLIAIQIASGKLLQRLDPKECFLTVNAMTSMSELRRVRKIAAHHLTQAGVSIDEAQDGYRDRPIECKTCGRVIDTG